MKITSNDDLLQTQNAKDRTASAAAGIQIQGLWEAHILHWSAKNFFFYSLYLCHNFWFNVIWHGCCMVTPILCSRLTETVATVTPSVTCTDWLCWWYKQAAAVVAASTACAFVTKMSDKSKSTSPTAIQVKNRRKTSFEQKLDVLRWFEKGKWIVDICHTVRFAYISIYTIHDNIDRITESTEVFM